MFLCIMWIILIPFIFICLPTRIIGKKYLKQIKKESAILCANHQTLNDPIIIKARVDFKIKIMAKASLFKSKFGNWFFRHVDAYPVNRCGGDIEAVKTTLRHLKNNKHVLIFPEGTRVKDGDLSELKNGVVMFALRTNCFVVPSLFKKRTNPFVFNTLLIGKPFKFSEIDEFKDATPTKDILDRASKVLSEKMLHLREISVKQFKKQMKLDLKK